MTLYKGTKNHLCGSDSLRPSRPSNALGVPVALPQHPNEHRPRRQILLAVGQEFGATPSARRAARAPCASWPPRSEEHTSELQSRPHLVCRLLLEKKKPLHK